MMVRLHNRQIKASFWTDTELIRALPRDGRLFYVGLWQLADDSGCIEDDSLAYKIHLFPADQDITPDVLDGYKRQLIDSGKLIPYQSNGKACLFITNFHKHQSLRSPAPPEVPLPPWVQWVPSEENRRSGKYVVGEPNGVATPSLTLSNGDRTATVRVAYGDQPEPEPEKEREVPNNVPTAGRDDAPKARRLTYSDEHMALAILLRDCILANKPDARVPANLAPWANTARLMVEIDKRDPERIAAVIRWCQAHEFWRSNILSMNKLREQFDRLELQMKRQKGRARDVPGFIDRSGEIEPPEDVQAKIDPTIPEHLLRRSADSA